MGEINIGFGLERFIFGLRGRTSRVETAHRVCFRWPRASGDSQIGVCLSYARWFCHSLIDRQLYLPKEWAEDPERCGTEGLR